MFSKLPEKLKDRILRELGYVFESEEPIGFFSITISKTDAGKILLVNTVKPIYADMVKE
jgi:hypothetical protein